MHKEQKETNKNIIGKQVSKERKKQGLAQKDLLARLQVGGTNISPSSLSKIEGQTRQVTDKELVAIAAALHTSIDTLLKTKKNSKNQSYTTYNTQ